MDTKSLPEQAHPLGEEKSLALEPASVPVFVDTYGGRVHVEWDAEGGSTPLGQLAFFVDFLKTADLLEPWMAECPLSYVSNNAPRKEDVLGTLFLSVLSGHRRYAHIDSVRYDTVSPGVLGMKKVVSTSSARRAFLNTDEEACAAWLKKHLLRSYEPLLETPWILDVDTSVKPLYGHQEGAVLGYNPTKPGRPSHVLHTYFMANTRLTLDVEVRPGNESAAKYTMPGLWAYLDGLARSYWPCFIRGDCNFGTEREMHNAESRSLPYLFKLRQTSKVKALITQVFNSGDWAPAGQGWQGVESELQLHGWTRKRRVIVLRRRLKGDVALTGALPETGQLALIEVEHPATRRYEYVVLVTSLTDPIATVAQHYRDRGDMENIYDEQKNQWGWGGYTTHDLKRNRIMARIIGLVYNWWLLYVRLAIPDRHAEAITSRPLLLYGVGQQTRHAGQTTLTITPMHAQARKIEQAVSRVNAFLLSVKSTARQLTWFQRWRMILAQVFSKILGGQPLAPAEPLPAPT